MITNIIYQRPNLPKTITYILAIFFALTPMDYILPHVGNATILRVAGVVIVVACVIYIVTGSKKKMILDKKQTIVLFLIIIYFVSIIWAKNQSVAVNYAISFGFTAGMYFLLFQFNYSVDQIRLIELGSIIGGVLLIWYVFNKVNLSLVFAGYRLDFDHIGGGEFSDPNGLAGRLMMPLIFTLKRTLGKSKFVIRLMNMVIIGFLVFVIFLTGSRTAIVGVLLATYLILVGLLRQKRAIAILSIIMIFVAVAIYLPSLLPQHIYTRIFSASQYEAVFNTEGDRIDIWRNAILKVFPNSPIWGYGAGNAPYAMYNIYGKIKAIHNTYFQCLIDTGLLGFIPWVGLLVIEIKTAFRLRKKDSYILAVLLSTVVMAFTLDAMKEKYLWNAFLYIFMKNSELFIYEKDL